MNSLLGDLYDDACLTHVKGIMDIVSREVDSVLWDFTARRINNQVRQISGILYCIEESIGLVNEIGCDIPVDIYDKTVRTYSNS